MTNVAVAPGPPAFTVNVKAWLGPAPSPVTTAVPVNTAAPPDTCIEVTAPVTYIALTSNCPLSAASDILNTAVGASARDAKGPPCPLAWNESPEVTGRRTGTPGPPALM